MVALGTSGSESNLRFDNAIGGTRLVCDNGVLLPFLGPGLRRCIDTAPSFASENSALGLSEVFVV